jgi:hypothetical protein
LDSKTNEWDKEYDERLHLSLTGSIRELVHTDDHDHADTRFQPPLINNQEHPGSEGYRLENSPNSVPSISLTVSKENVLARHKRAPLATSPMDGSGITEEGSGVTEEGNKVFSKILFLCWEKKLANI